MFLSIVIPIYNDEKYLNECLDSCLDQELSKDEYEIICVDDGSTDRTPDILRKYAEQYSNIRIITKQHGGQYGNGRTIGLSNAVGAYVWFVDHDDIVAPGAVDDLYQAILQNPGIDRVGFRCYEFFDDLTAEEQAALKARTLNSNDDDIYKNIVTWASILRIDFLRENDILPRSKRIDAAAAFWGIENYRVWSGDTIFMDECFDKGMESVRLSGRPLYHYRRHQNTETMSKSPEMLRARKTGMLNTGLYWTYLAYLQKQRYTEEQRQNGNVSAETLGKTIFQVKRAAEYMLKLPAKQWWQGYRRMKEKDVFFRRMPETYTPSFREYWKQCTKRQRLFPENIAVYYVITRAGAFWTRILSWPRRVIANSTFHEKRRTQRVAARRKAVGLGQV